MVLVAYFVGWAVSVYSMGKILNIFFDKRKTGSFVFALSHLPLFFGAAITFWLLNVPMISMISSLLFIFILTLNFETKMLRRIVAIATTFMMAALVELLLTLISEVYVTSAFERAGTADENTAAWLFLLMGLMKYTLAVIFSKFKNIKKEKSQQGTLYWLSILFMPVASIMTMLWAVVYFPPSISVVFFGLFLPQTYLRFIFGTPSRLLMKLGL